MHRIFNYPKKKYCISKYRDGEAEHYLEDIIITQFKTYDFFTQVFKEKYSKFKFRHINHSIFTIPTFPILMVKQYNFKFQEDNNQNYFKLNHAIENQWMRLKVKNSSLILTFKLEIFLTF